MVREPSKLSGCLELFWHWIALVLNLEKLGMTLFVAICCFLLFGLRDVLFLADVLGGTCSKRTCPACFLQNKWGVILHQLCEGKRLQSSELTRWIEKQLAKTC